VHWMDVDIMMSCIYVVHVEWYTLGGLLVRIGLWSSGQMYVLEFESQWEIVF
jgi:hypothetical protein